MFQPPSPPLSGGRRLPIAVLVGVVAAVLIAGLWLTHRSPSRSTSPTRPGQAAAQTLKGEFSATTMTCPGQRETSGDTCVVPVHLNGDVRIAATFSADTLMALGVRDVNGHDLGPQVTSYHGSVVFTAAHVADGTYQLRIVDVTHPASPFPYTVTITG